MLDGSPKIKYKLIIPYIPHIYRSNGQTDEASQDENDSTDMSDDNNNTMAQEATSEAFPPTKTAVTESTPLPQHQDLMHQTSELVINRR